MNTFDAYYANKTPGNACRLAATDHRAQGMCNFDFIADLNKAGELADHAPDLLAMLEQSLPLLLAHHRNSSEGAITITGIRQLIATIKGE